MRVDPDLGFCAVGAGLNYAGLALWGTWPHGGHPEGAAAHESDSPTREAPSLRASC